ncbi:hypothetical protein [Bradyrhizobium ottawaense]
MMSVVAALLRTDLRYFIQRAFMTVFPGSDYLPNWHVEAIVYQLVRVHAGESTAAAAQARGGGRHMMSVVAALLRPPSHQPAAAVAQIALSLGRVRRLAARPRP